MQFCCASNSKLNLQLFFCCCFFTIVLKPQKIGSSDGIYIDSLLKTNKVKHKFKCFFTQTNNASFQWDNTLEDSFHNTS